LNYEKLTDVIEKANKKCHELYDYDKQLEKIESIYDEIILKLGDNCEKK